MCRVTGLWGLWLCRRFCHCQMAKCTQLFLQAAVIMMKAWKGRVGWTVGGGGCSQCDSSICLFLSFHNYICLSLSVLFPIYLFLSYYLHVMHVFLFSLQALLCWILYAGSQLDAYIIFVAYDVPQTFKLYNLFSRWFIVFWASVHQILFDWFDRESTYQLLHISLRNTLLVVCLIGIAGLCCMS